jgi:glucosyl-3-phosphoglycerate synthase
VPIGKVFSAIDFDAAVLADAKASASTSISVCIPARDEEATIGAIVATLRRDLIERVSLLDEIIVMDDSSNDATSSAASAQGARVVPVRTVLPELGIGTGKGNALWRSLYECTGDVIVWIDADIRNFSSQFVTALVGPLLTDPTVGFTKGLYRRPLDGAATGGGRVTELMARPLLSHYFPELARIVQPLSGEYAARRSIVECVPFVEGWGVETALLIDVASRFGIDAIAQVDLDVREHRNRPLSELSPQAMAILITVLRRAGLEPTEAEIEDFVRVDQSRDLEHVSVTVGERPPMLDVAAYRERFPTR